MHFQPFYSHFCDFLGQFLPIFAYIIILEILILTTNRPYVLGHISANTYPICFIRSLFERYFQGVLHTIILKIDPKKISDPPSPLKCKKIQKYTIFFKIHLQIFTLKLILEVKIGSLMAVFMFIL